MSDSSRSLQKACGRNGLLRNYQPVGETEAGSAGEQPAKRTFQCRALFGDRVRRMFSGMSHEKPDDEPNHQHDKRDGD